MDALRNGYSEIKWSETNSSGKWEIRKFKRWWAVFRNGTDIGHERTKGAAITICQSWGNFYPSAGGQR